MKKFMVLIAILVSLLSLPSCRPAVVVAERPGPPVYVRPAAPRAGYVWVDGDWYARGRGYQWREGYWAAPRSRTWSTGHWAPRRNGWYWKKGHWR